MAEAIFSAVIGDAVSRVISLLTGYFSQQRSSEVKLRRICDMLIRIHSVVEEAKGRQIENHGTLEWLSELIDGEYQGRYLLDTIGYGEHELEDDEHGDDKVTAPQVSSSLSLFNPAKRMRVAACAVKSVLRLRRDLGLGDIDRVLESLQRVSGDLREFIMLLQSCRPVRRPLATSIFIDGQMFGRHVEKERIVNFLLHDSGVHLTGELGVLPIVGDIGVGKTTLVQHACDDVRVRSHFPVIVLYNFSCTYAVATNGGTAVLWSKHVIGDAGNLKDPLQLVRGNFHNKKFLMVFEDVDMHKKQMLEELLPILRCGKKGSKIIFTTNNRRIASLGTVEPIILKVLPCPEYWFFFKAHAFAGRDIEENQRLVAVGKAVARKLNGSFFGAKIVGGLLRDHPNPKFWSKVQRSNIGGLSLLGDGLGYIADLSENLLPTHVVMALVTISKVPWASQTALARFQDLCEPHGTRATCLADDVLFARVLLCKSVMPFYNCYYIASCTIGSIGSSNSCSELTAV
ncbi:putative disease resistance protein RGA4 [Phragmites australis]|uniref:putative disease resistance protein RGA4 n=1 Tax=Phragmites australis TaxID=29695 RepID=UPI002D7A0943|nr:putative disease resistance protein RGA4 [Phragmites australis]